MMPQTRIKYLIFTTLLISLFYISSSQIIGVNDIKQTFSPNVKQDLLPIRPPIIKILKSLNLQNSQTYKFTTQISIPNQQSNYTQCYISFSKYTQNCKQYKQCYYGWVDNYTISNNQPIKGYPSQNQSQIQIQPIFQYKINSKNDYIISRHPDLNDIFVNIIQVGCQLYEPTIKDISRDVKQNIYRRYNDINIGDDIDGDGGDQARFVKINPEIINEDIQYDFISSEDFQRIQPIDTYQIKPQLLDIDTDILSRIYVNNNNIDTGVDTSIDTKIIPDVLNAATLNTKINPTIFSKFTQKISINQINPNSNIKNLLNFASTNPQPINTINTLNPLKLNQAINPSIISSIKTNPKITLNTNYNPKIYTIPQIRIASLKKQLPIQDLNTKVNEFKQKITIDKSYSILKRSRVIDLNIPSDSFTDQAQVQAQAKPDFISNVKIQFNRAGTQITSHSILQKYIDRFTQPNTNINTNLDLNLNLNYNPTQKISTFTSKSIQASRLNPNLAKLNIYNQDFKIVDNIKRQPITYKLNDTKIFNIQKSISTCIPIRTFATLKAASVKVVDQLDLPVKQLSNRVIAADGGVPVYNNRRLLLQTNVFSYQKLLFQKQILGKKFKVSIKVDASVIDNKNIRFRGVITYSLFGNVKTVQAFNYVKDIHFNWSQNYNINGQWSFNIYIPLPPPVSFLGINFAFTVNFGLSIDLYAKGNPYVYACVYKFEVGANVGTEVGVDASAAIRAIVIEGGVFIRGTLVRLSTDPKISLALNVSTKVIKTSVSWYFYIKAFSFEWGFFYRYWRLFKGWSDKKIIAKWPINNGITKAYLIYKSP